MKDKLKSSTYGIIFIIIAFLSWGLTPIYFKALQTVNPLEILAHRILWSIFFLMTIVAYKKQIYKLIEVFYSPKKIATLICTSILISANWLTYIWAILNNHLMESSFGYFISPIFNIMLGLIFLKEKLNNIQKISLSITIIAIIIQFTEISFIGFTPFIPILLAGTFGFYALLRKQVQIDSIHGLTIETLILAPIALLYIFYLKMNAELTFLTNINLSILLCFAGVITSIPLLLYVSGAKLLPLTKVGFFQYISPTLQLLIAVFIFKENINNIKILSFSLVWIALLFYVMNSVWIMNKNRRTIQNKVS